MPHDIQSTSGTITQRHNKSEITSSSKPSSSHNVQQNHARSNRVSKRAPNYDLPSVMPLTPMPPSVLALFFSSSALQLLLMIHLASGISPMTEPRLIALAASMQVIYLLIAWISVKAPTLALILSPLTFIPTWLFPASFRFFTFICTIAQCVYFLHILSLHPFMSGNAFKSWNVWLRSIFILSYLDMRDCQPIEELVEAKKRDPNASSWPLIKPYLRPHILSCAWLNVLMIISFYAVITLPSMTFSEAASLAVRGETWPLLMGWAKYVSVFLMTTWSLSFVDHFYCMIFLTLGLKIQKSQNDPLTSTSLGGFWSGRWNMVIHSLLYHFFYLPLHRRNLRTAGVVMAFAASAVLHIYPAIVAGTDFKHALAILGFFFGHAFLMQIEKKLHISKPWVGMLYVWFSIFITLPLLCEPFIHLISQTK